MTAAVPDLTLIGSLRVSTEGSRRTVGRFNVLDADLQDPPELLGPMMARMDQGYDVVVYGKRTARAGETALKLGTARLFYRLLNRPVDVDIQLDTGDFRLMS